MNGHPKRVLHVVRAMNRGGVETWLLHVLRRLDRRRVEMDFLVHTDEPGAYDAEVLDRGARLLRNCAPLWSPAYALQIARILRGPQPYDAIHSHVHHFSGYLLALSRRCGIRTRIAHSHCVASRGSLNARWIRQAYTTVSRHWLARHATHLVAASRPAARALFGDHWARDPRGLVLHCGLDFTAFHRDSQRASTRSLLNIRDGELVVGHVGRFDPAKNQGFLLTVTKAVMRLHRQTRLVLVGDGPLRQSVEALAGDAGLANRVIFTGSRDDVPRLLGAMDVFAFPSQAEGLGLSLVEAQAAGLPCVLSSAVPDEADVVPALMHRVSLDAGAELWASSILSAWAQKAGSGNEALSLVEKSSFNVCHSVEQLYALYNA